MGEGANLRLGRAWAFWLLTAIICAILASATIAAARAVPVATLQEAPADVGSSVLLKRGEPAEQVEGNAWYFVTPEDQKLTGQQALAQFRSGSFSREYQSTRSEILDERRLWIALPIDAAADNETSIRRSVGLGGVFYVRPDVYLVREDAAPTQILGGEATDSAELLARKLTYLHSSSFMLSPGEKATVLVNLALVDRPSIGLFREGELGRNQIIGTMLKAIVFLSFIGVGVCLVVLGVLANRKITALLGIGLMLAAIQADVSLFVTILSPDFETARAAWRACISIVSLSNLYIVLFAFRGHLDRFSNPAVRLAIWLLPLSLVAGLFYQEYDAYLLLLYYSLLLALVAVIVFRLEMAKGLRQIVVGIIGLCPVVLIAVEPDIVGTVIPELSVGFIRDMVRLVVAGTLLVFVVVDIRRSLEERDRLRLERISALEASAQTSRRLLETEREYSRARETAARRKQQLASASHDIRQPLVGLRASIRAEADNLSPVLQERLSEAVDYLEELTREYSDQDGADQALFNADKEVYSLELIVQTVEDMFAQEAAGLGVELRILTEPCETSVPALALIRSVSNLVANALRHASPSEVRVSIRHEDTCLIEVSDDGKGMDEQALSKARQRGGKDEASSGDGLGLAIVHDLAQRHGFAFRLTSQPGKGTVAAIKLPPAR